MRAFLAAALVATALPAVAQDTIADQVGTAYEVFGQSLSPDGLSEGRYFEEFSRGIDGTWVLASALIPEDGDLGELEAQIATACASPVVTRMAVSGPMSIEFRRGRPESELVVTYVYTGAASFDPQIDTTNYLGYLGLLDNEQARFAVVNALNASTTPVMMFRHAQNVIALVRMRGLSEIYARCGAAGDGEVDAAAFEAALGAAFDQQYPKIKNAEVRATFIGCVVAAMSPLPASDIQLFIDTSFQPPQEDMQRIGDAYPEVRDAVVVCGEAADAALGR